MLLAPAGPRGPPPRFTLGRTLLFLSSTLIFFDLNPVRLASFISSRLVASIAVCCIAGLLAAHFGWASEKPTDEAEPVPPPGPPPETAFPRVADSHNRDPTVDKLAESPKGPVRSIQSWDALQERLTSEYQLAVAQAKVGTGGYPAAKALARSPLGMTVAVSPLKPPWTSFGTSGRRSLQHVVTTQMVLSAPPLPQS
eukprot:5228897-Prymnesium_polylepis.1